MRDKLPYQTMKILSIITLIIAIFISFNYIQGIEWENIIDLINNNIILLITILLWTIVIIFYYLSKKLEQDDNIIEECKKTNKILNEIKEIINKKQ